MSSCTTTVPNSVRNSAPVGHTSRHAAWVQCLQTSDSISQRNSERGAPSSWPGSPDMGIPRSTGTFTDRCSIVVPSAVRSPSSALSAVRLSTSAMEAPTGWPTRPVS